MFLVDQRLMEPKLGLCVPVTNAPTVGGCGGTGRGSPAALPAPNATRPPLPPPPAAVPRAFLPLSLDVSL